GPGPASGGSAEKAGVSDRLTKGQRGEASEPAGRRGSARWARPERGGAQMTWASFYLICFLAGLFLSAFTLLGGMGHFGGADQAQVPHFPHVPHVHVPHASHLPHGTGGADLSQGPATVPWWNAFSIMIFLCWFGA